MLVLVETNDLGSALLYFGIFLAMLYVATGRALYVAIGAGLFLAGAFVVYHFVGHVRDRVDDLAAPVDRPRGLLPDQRQAAAAPGLRELPARQVALLDRARRTGSAPASARAPSTTTGGPRADPVPEHRLHLLGARAGARPGRRRRAAARLHALRRARLPDRAARRRRLLEAARGRADLRLRAADVHHRRRDPAADPADRDHAAVRQLRRLERGRELRPARGPPAGLQPRERGARDEPADRTARTRRASCS